MNYLLFVFQKGSLLMQEHISTQITHYVSLISEDESWQNVFKVFLAAFRKKKKTINSKTNKDDCLESLYWS